MPTNPASYNLNFIARNALNRYGFLSEMSQRAVNEAKAMHPDFWPHLEPGVKDLTELLWSSIDNDDSRDLDQVEYCEVRPDGRVHVMIAIADVDHYVRQGTYSDAHAIKNAVTVYTGVEIFPMLPERLCNDLTSLIPGEDRLAVVMDFLVNSEGEVKSGEVYRAVIRNHAKLIYEIVGDWFEGRTPLPESVEAVPGLEDQLLLQDKVAQAIKEARRRNGALEFDSIETKPVFKEKQVIEIALRHRNRAHQLIENFMIAANGVMVNFLRSKNSPVIQRVVKTPERWERIVEIAIEMGDSLPNRPKAKALSDFLERQRKRDPERFPDLSLAVIKLLGQGEYDVVFPGKKGDGHFGLAVSDYTHSTAPNRRYIDLVVQRLLKAALNKARDPYSRAELSHIAGWCTDRDQFAKKVERFMRKVAAAMMLLDRVGDSFEGIVTGASEKGTYVRLIDPPAEGRVVRRFEGMDVGDKVIVRLIKLSPERGYVDFEGSGEAQAPKPSPDAYPHKKYRQRQRQRPRKNRRK
ncbi:MAG: RNB domain-containing ribonuclease [Candidatus Omnitrophica bacterium]|nr:RNB domain-containing ribonuclease [Candidatus Omnitrophota bacterium]